MAGRRYLEDENVAPVGGDLADDARGAKWAEERATYGFDSRDTWSLDYTMVVLLFERTLMFQDAASSVVDLTFHKFDVDGESLSQEEAITRLLSLCRTYFAAEDTFGADAGQTQEIWRLWAIISPAMWW